MNLDEAGVVLKAALCDRADAAALLEATESLHKLGIAASLCGELQMALERIKNTDAQMSYEAKGIEDDLKRLVKKLLNE